VGIDVRSGVGNLQSRSGWGVGQRTHDRSRHELRLRRVPVEPVYALGFNHSDCNDLLFDVDVCSLSDRCDALYAQACLETFRRTEAQSQARRVHCLVFKLVNQPVRPSGLYDYKRVEKDRAFAKPQACMGLGGAVRGICACGGFSFNLNGGCVLMKNGMLLPISPTTLLMGSWSFCRRPLKRIRRTRIPRAPACHDGCKTLRALSHHRPTELRRLVRNGGRPTAD